MADPAALQATVSQWVTLGPELALRLQSGLGKPRAADQGRGGGLTLPGPLFSCTIQGSPCTQSQTCSDHPTLADPEPRATNATPSAPSRLHSLGLAAGPSLPACFLEGGF